MKFFAQVVLFLAFTLSVICTKINIKGLDKPTLLIKLWENAPTGRSAPGFSAPFSYAEAAEACNKFIDYFHDRSLKIDISGDVAESDAYDRDAGEGMFQHTLDEMRTQKVEKQGCNAFTGPDCGSVDDMGANQIYGYSSFNNTRYSALTTQHELHPFKRDGDSSLIIADPIPLHGISYGNNNISYYTCWLFLLFSAREDGIYSSPKGTPLNATFPDPDTKITFQPTKSPIRKLYSLREIKADQIHFEENLVIGKGAVGTVVPGKLYGTPMIKFKMYDTYHDSSYNELSQKETLTCKKLKVLQGKVIPKFYGYFNYHGIIILALEDCGVPVSEDEYLSYKLKIDQCIKALREKGVEHRDLELRGGVYPNILRKGDDIRIIDFHL